MTTVIKVNREHSVIVSFVRLPVLRLTPQGFEKTESLLCSIDSAQGLRPLGAGVALRSNEDEPDYAKGMALALTRAAQEAFPFDKEARAKLHELLQDALKNVTFVTGEKQGSSPEAYY